LRFVASQCPVGFLIFAFRPLSGKQKIKQILCVLSVSAVKTNIKFFHFWGVYQATLSMGGI
jgi:hypothetical protein